MFENMKKAFVHFSSPILLVLPVSVFRPKDFLLIPTIGCEVVDEQAASLLLGNLEHFQQYLPGTTAIPEPETPIDEEHAKRLDVSKPKYI